MRNYSTEHSKRQKSKKRLAWEVDRECWDKLKATEQAAIKKYITEILATEVGSRSE